MKTPPESQRTSIRVLFIEDSENDVLLMVSRLRRSGLEPSYKRTQSEDELRSALEEGSWDVILSDYSLPSFTAVDALRLTRTYDPEVPFLVVSGSVGEETAAELIRLGAQDYLLKDRLGRLGVAVRQAIGDAALRREKLRSDHALLEAQHHYHASFDFAPIGIVHALLDGQVTRVNKSLCDILKYTETELLDRNLESLTHPDDRQGTLIVLERLMSGEEDPAQFDQRYIASDGRVIWVHVWSTLIRDLLGRPRYILRFISDETERRRAADEHAQIREELARSERLTSLGHVAAGIAHEFNNVLMGIAPFAEALAKRCGTDPSLQAATRHIAASIDRGKRVTREILRFTRPSEPRMESLDAGALVSELQSELLGLLPPSIRLAISLPDEALRISADRDLLSQLLVNLAANARDAIPHGGTITVSVSPYTAHRAAGLTHPLVHLEVQDTGVGIPQEGIARLFDPFYTTKRSGTGLGLSIAQQIVAQHGGVIIADSTVGVGTTLHVILPGASAESAQRAPSHKTEVKSPPLHFVVLVEDEVAVAEGLIMLLELEKIEVRWVDRGADAVTVIGKRIPDLVLLDVGLPDISGIDVCSQIASRWPDLPIVYSTGQADDDSIVNAFPSANVRAIHKPYALEELLDLWNEFNAGD